ncbi:MAG: 50S ribosomal protein L11 methyltransferase, partial [Blautia sp.]|nr:50S ribosomal protein L11 methyltransferase [Blautia sp.]
MKWTRITISTSTEAEDVLVSALADIGIEGVEIEDHVPLTQAELDQMFVDIMPAGPADDGTAKLHFYLGEEQNISKTLKQVEEILEETRSYMDIGEGTITQSETEDTDWINNWKQYFHQFFED